MPIYYYEDKLTGYSIDVLRSFDEYTVEPTDEELPESERGKEREWHRLLTKAPTVTRARGFGRKGYWIQLLIGAGAVCARYLDIIA